MNQPLEILAYEQTPLGTLVLRKRELLSRPGKYVTEVTLNHEFLMSSYLTDSERSLTRIGLEQLADSQSIRVLVGGLGLGYTAAEALDNDNVTSVEVVEFLPEVIEWVKNRHIPLADLLLADPRLTVSHGDIYARLADSGAGEFDLIVIDVDHSPEDVLGEQSQGFYTVEGLKRARSHLADGGAIGIWSYADDSPLLDSMKSVFESVFVEQVTVWNDLIDEEQTDWLFFGSHVA